MCLFLVSRSIASETTEPFDEAWRWVHFTTESGLPSNIVYSLVETNDGTVWVETSAGIAWFDGYEWVPIRSTTGFPSGRAVVFTADLNDSLLVRYDKKLYRGTPGGFRLIGIDAVGWVVPFSKDSLLFTDELRRQIYLFDNETVTEFPTPEGSVMWLWRTKGGSIWVHTDGGLYRWELNRWKRKIRADHRGLELISPQSLIENTEGVGLVSIGYPYEQRGIWEWTRGTGPRINPEEKPDLVKSADIGPDGSVILVHENGNHRIRRNGHWDRLVFRSQQISEAEFIRFGRNGDLWVGTQRGLFLYRQSLSPWTYIEANPPSPQSSVNEIIQTKDGSLWLATDDGIAIHSKGARVKSVRNIAGRELYSVTGLLEDNDGNVWVSSGGSFGGVFRWSGSRWQYINRGTPIEGSKIHKVRKDALGRVWLLGIWGDTPRSRAYEPGAFVFADGKFDRWGVGRGLPSGRVYSFADGQDGSLWFGTSKGLSRWRDGEWTHWKGLPSQTPRVWALEMDPAGRLWFSNRRDLLGYVDQKDSVHYVLNSGSFGNTEVWDLTTGPGGELWISTAGGLYSYHDEQWSTFGMSSGLQNSHLWPVLPLEDKVYVGMLGTGLAVLHLGRATQPNPRITFAKPIAEEQSVLLRWRALAYWGDPSPQNILTRYRIGQGPWSDWSTARTITVSDLGAGEYNYHVQAKGVFGDFDPTGASGSFTVALPLFRHPVFLIPTLSLAASVVILGLILLLRKRKHDTELRRSEAKFRAVAETTASAIVIHKEGRIFFVNPGTQVLTGYSETELLAMSFWDIIHPDHRSLFFRPREDSVDRWVRRHLEFKIVTKDGKKLWVDYTEGDLEFHGDLVTLGTAFDITERKEAEQKILRNQAQLRSLASELLFTEERERRRMATFLHDSIGQSLAICKIELGALQQKVSPEISPFVIEIKKHLDESIQNTRSLTFELSPPVLHELGLVPAVEWLLENMRKQHEITFSIDDDGEAKPLEDDVRILLFYAVRELLVNVVKHAEAKNASICARRDGNKIRVLVEDDGIGYDVAEVATQLSKNGGFGLFNIRERLAHLGGTMNTDSSPGGGTRIEIVAPLQVNSMA